MRLIDADELKEAMEEHTDYKGYLVCDPDEIIDLAPTIEIPQWIPCTDRLPEKTGYYLVTDRRGVVYSTSFDYLRMGKMCFGYDDLDGCFNEDNTVVAWMPLPTPYMKEGDQE